jgi:hypothetical protein
VYPALVAAAFGYWGNAGVLLKGCRVGKALAALSEGNEKSWSESRASAWKGSEDREIGELGSKSSDLFIEASYAGAGCSELGEQGLDEQPHRSDHGCIAAPMALIRRSMVALYRTLAEFNAHGVEYLVVGAHALAVHGFVRATKTWMFGSGPILRMRHAC